MKHLFPAFLSLLFAALPLTAGAAEVPFDQAQFDAAQAAGKPLAVVFHADWCPTCRAQAPVLTTLSRSEGLKSLTLFVADFDTQKTLKKSLGVTKQSTVVVFKGRQEVARSTGDTQSPALESLLRKAVTAE